MTYLTVEVEIDHGRIIARESEKLPATGTGLLTVLPPGARQNAGSTPWRQRVELPLIQGDGKHIINPTPEELDASLWAD